MSKGDETVLREKLNEGGATDLSLGGESGLSLLHQAARGGLVGVVTTLIDMGAGIDSPNHNGATPLHVASQHNHPATVKALVTGGARVEAKDKVCDVDVMMGDQMYMRG